MKNLIFAITGASGGILAKRALEFWAYAEFTTHIVYSAAGEKVYGYETENAATDARQSTDDKSCQNAASIFASDACLNNVLLPSTENALQNDLSGWIENGARFRVYDNGDLFAPVASGSFPSDAMIIMPCSMSTAAKIAAGFGDTLITRAAACCIKEKTPCVIVPRESPLSAIHLQSLLTLSQNGVFIMPPVPAFYDRVTEFDAVVDAIVGRVLKTAGVENGMYGRWGQESTL
jgi:4-hydroxy-3-polyprenylbenzoate decarboxylase